MKFKCFCEKNFFDLTVEEVRHMRRSGPKSIDVERFINYYEINFEQYRERLKTLKGISPNYTEKDYGANLAKSNKVVMKNEERKRGIEKKPNRVTVKDIPDSVVAAIYQVEFEIRGNRIFYNTEELNKAKEDMENKEWVFNNLMEESKDTTVYSELKNIDLVAMRIYRGRNRKAFSSMSGVTIREIKYFESGSVKIPRYIEEEYRKILTIKDRHINQLRDIMNGKTDKVEEDRTIPKLVKLFVFKRDNGQCTECGSSEKLHYHHIKYFSDGGQNTKDNLKLLCASCYAIEHKNDKSYHMLKSMAEG